MKTRSIPLWLGSLGVAALLLCGTARPQDPADAPPAGPADPATAQEEGVEVQARGPVHEAFAEPISGQPRPSPIVPKKPPDPVEEMPPDQKPEGNNVQWIPGYWQFDDE